MNRILTTLVVIFLLLSFTPIQNTRAESELGKISDSDFTEIYGLQGTDYLLVNSTGSYLMDVRTQTINSNISCNSNIRISADREYVMCLMESTITITTLTLKFNGPIDMENTPRDNNSIHAGSSCPLSEFKYYDIQPKQSMDYFKSYWCGKNHTIQNQYQYEIRAYFS